MRFTHLQLDSWRNFKSVDVPLQQRVFLVGPNASGKSNLLDALRFLRDLADPQGGFQGAVKKRGGVSHLRSLHARRYPDIVIDAAVDLDREGRWRYHLAFNQDNRGQPYIKEEIVHRGAERVIHRPEPEDKADPSRLSQTYLEQVNANKAFRPLNAFFAQVQYLHLVPQLVREPERSVGRVRDPFGGDFLERLADLQRLNRRVFESRLKRINKALNVAVPNLDALELKRDNRGVPHLNGLYKHWRKDAGWQSEEQFSDGTLRLFGLLWALLDGTGPLLLEEPELSLHEEVVRYIPTMMATMGARAGRQIMVSTHSRDLLSDQSIAGEEVLLLKPSREDTELVVAATDRQIKALLSGGMRMGEIVLPKTAPKNADQLALFPQ